MMDAMDAIDAIDAIAMLDMLAHFQASLRDVETASRSTWDEGHARDTLASSRSLRHQETQLFPTIAVPAPSLDVEKTWRPKL